MNDVVAAVDDRGAHELPAVVHHFANAPAEMLGAILDQSLDCIKLIGPGGKLDFMNRNGRCAMEIDDFAAIAGRDWWDLWPAEVQPLIHEALARARAGDSFRFEAFCPTAKGSPRWWEVSVSPLHDEAGALQGVVSVSRDISDRIAARELRETTAAELRHRLQNAYTLAGAIVSSTAKGSHEHEAFAADVLNRLQRLGAAQSLLLESEERVDLAVLLGRLTEPFCGQDCELRFNGIPAVQLAEDDVRILALTIGELSTNSNKYGALRHGGSIDISGSANGRRLGLTWTERSRAPNAEAPNGRGSGHRLIDRALRARGGEFEIRWQADGPEASLTLPLFDWHEGAD